MTTSSTSRAWAVGGLVFAATMMIMLGVWEVFVGIAAIADDRFFVVGPNYTYDMDTTAWGWIHLVLGALAVVAGFFLYTGATWARAVGIGLAALVAINNFVFLPYFPLWSLAMMALAVFVIWALATARVDRAADAPAGEMSGYYRNAGGEPRPAPDRWPSNRTAAGQHRTDEPAADSVPANGVQVEQVTERPPLGRQ